MVFSILLSNKNLISQNRNFGKEFSRNQGDGFEQKKEEGNGGVGVQPKKKKREAMSGLGSALRKPLLCL